MYACLTRLSVCPYLIERGPLGEFGEHTLHTIRRRGGLGLIRLGCLALLRRLLLRLALLPLGRRGLGLKVRQCPGLACQGVDQRGLLVLVLGVTLDRLGVVLIHVHPEVQGQVLCVDLCDDAVGRRQHLGQLLAAALLAIQELQAGLPWGNREEHGGSVGL